MTGQDWIRLEILELDSMAHLRNALLQQQHQKRSALKIKKVSTYGGPKKYVNTYALGLNCATYN